MAGFVYLMREQSQGLIKIGFSVNVESRLKEFKTGNPTIELQGKFEAKPEHERALHVHFSEKRKSGEWFMLEDEDIISVPKLLESWSEFNGTEWIAEMRKNRDKPIMADDIDQCDNTDWYEILNRMDEMKLKIAALFHSVEELEKHSAQSAQQ